VADEVLCAREGFVARSAVVGLMITMSVTPIQRVASAQEMRAELAVVVQETAVSDTSQKSPPEKKATPSKLRVFLDCGWCDQDYIRQRIKFVEYVRDRTDAQVHVLATSLSAGNTLLQTVVLIGLREFANHTDTLEYSLSWAESQDLQRVALTKALTRGLASFAAKTGMADRLTVTYEPSVAAGTTTTTVAGNVSLPQNDPWDRWTFNLGVSGWASGERSSSTLYLYNSVTADRTTGASRFSMVYSSSISRMSYDVGDRMLRNSTRTDYVMLTWARTLGPHWAAGTVQTAATSEQANKRLGLSVVPMLEYNLFPYSEFDRRSLVLAVGAGADRFHYLEETIYFVTQETRPRAVVSLSGSATEPWGNLSLYTDASRYINNAKLYHVSSSLYGTFRLFKGFELTSSVYLSSVHDQLGLRRGGATVEDVLLARRQLETSYRISTSVGLSYRFGSALNTAVNPALRAGVLSGR
jgi:hypothetical protein